MGRAVLKNESSAPSSPAAGKIIIYPKTDKKLYYKDEDGVEHLLQASGWIPIQRQSAAAATQLDFTTGIDSTYDLYKFILTGIVPATDNTDLWARITKDAGSTWRATAGDYKWARNLLSDAATNTPAGSTSDVKLLLAANLGNVAGEVVYGTLYLPQPSNASFRKGFWWDLSQNSSTPNCRHIFGGGFYTLDTGAINGVRFLMSSGNITLTAALYGLKLT